MLRRDGCGNRVANTLAHCGRGAQNQEQLGCDCGGGRLWHRKPAARTLANATIRKTSKPKQTVEETNAFPRLSTALSCALPAQEVVNVPTASAAGSRGAAAAGGQGTSRQGSRRFSLAPPNPQRLLLRGGSPSRSPCWSPPGIAPQALTAAPSAPELVPPAAGVQKGV